MHHKHCYSNIYTIFYFYYLLLFETIENKSLKEINLSHKHYLFIIIKEYTGSMFNDRNKFIFAL